MSTIDDNNKWLTSYFQHSSDVIMVFKGDQLIMENQAAQHLREKYLIDSNYLLQIAQNGRQQANSSSAMTNTVAAVTSKKEQAPLHLALFYRLLDQTNDVYALTIENRQRQEKLTSLEEQQLMNRYVNRAHEREQQQISQDLHDSIAQGVYSGIMGVRRIMQGQLAPQQIQATCRAIEMQLQETLAEIKEMALDIRPAVLDSFGLIPAIKTLAKRLQASSGVVINILAADESTVHLSQDVQNALYRVCQEAINNALRHAHPSEVNVLLTKHSHAIQMQILDDGCGFVLSQQDKFNGHSLGLMNMKERIAALNGSFQISSQPGEGTTVTVKFPFN